MTGRLACSLVEGDPGFDLRETPLLPGMCQEDAPGIQNGLLAD